MESRHARGFRWCGSDDAVSRAQSAAQSAANTARYEAYSDASMSAAAAQNARAAIVRRGGQGGSGDPFGGDSGTSQAEGFGGLPGGGGGGGFPEGSVFKYTPGTPGAATIDLLNPSKPKRTYAEYKKTAEHPVSASYYASTGMGSW